MKSIFVTIGLLFAILMQGIGQVPQQFSYQAVLRNTDGSVMANQAINVKISLHKVLPAGDVVYTETQNVTTTVQGIISLSIGSGNMVDFAAIPWSQNIFIQIEIKKPADATFQSIGTSQILSVPYALYAGSVKEVVSPTSANSDDPIFEVKNRDGKVVFGVYQGGVRVYVDDSPTAKGARGGFAVGGLTNQGKAASVEYMHISPDSARIYINDGGSAIKGARGGFAVGGLTNQGKSANKEYFKVTKDSSYFSNTILTTADIVTTGSISTGGGTASQPVTDIDGFTYKTVKIGTQTWMSENLRAKHYSYGKSIYPYDTAYNNTANEDTIKNYGRLYSYFAVMDTSNVCPNGWHVPSPPDWDSLLTYVGGPYWKRDSIITGLRLMDKNFWSVPNNANNASGFSGRPGGQAMQSAQWFFSGMGTEANWWGKFGTVLKLDSSGGVVVGSGNPSNAFSVRCVKGKGITAPTK